VSRLFRQCGILNISQPYRPPRPVTGKALLYSAVIHVFGFTVFVGRIFLLLQCVAVLDMFVCCIGCIRFVFGHHVCLCTLTDKVYKKVRPTQCNRMIRYNKQTNNKPLGLSPRANYTDRATSPSRRSYCRRDGFPRSYPRIFRPETLHFLSSTSSVVLTKLSEPRSRPAAFPKIL
jgi:hypothetical protein